MLLCPQIAVVFFITEWHEWCTLYLLLYSLSNFVLLNCKFSLELLENCYKALELLLHSLTLIFVAFFICFWKWMIKGSFVCLPFKGARECLKKRVNELRNTWLTRAIEDRTPEDPSRPPCKNCSAKSTNLKKVRRFSKELTPGMDWSGEGRCFKCLNRPSGECSKKAA